MQEPPFQNLLHLIAETVLLGRNKRLHIEFSIFLADLRRDSLLQHLHSCFTYEDILQRRAVTTETFRTDMWLCCIYHRMGGADYSQTLGNSPKSSDFRTNFFFFFLLPCHNESGRPQHTLYPSNSFALRTAKNAMRTPHSKLPRPGPHRPPHLRSPNSKCLKFKLRLPPPRRHGDTCTPVLMRKRNLRINR